MSWFSSLGCFSLGVRVESLSAAVFGYATSVVALLVVTGCKSDPLTSSSAIRERAAWLSMKRHEMRAEAHRRGLGSICVLPVRGNTQLLGPWQNPNAQLQLDENERRSHRTQLSSMYKRFGFVVIDRTETELLQIEHQVHSMPGRRLSTLGHLGRTLGTEIIMSMRLDVLRESYFVPYVGWKTRGWATFDEKYWDTRNDTLLASFVWKGRERDYLLDGLEDTPLFEGFKEFATRTRLRPKDVHNISEHWAMVSPSDTTWQTNYILGGWFGAEAQGLSFPAGSQLAISHYEQLIRKRPQDSILTALARLKTFELQGNMQGAGEMSLTVAQLLQRRSPLWLGEVERASRLLDVPVSLIHERLGVNEQPASSAAVSGFEIEKFERAIVGIVTIREDEDKGIGSGFVVSANGTVLTNAHVVERAKSIEVKYWDGVWGSADLIAKNEDVDLALLSITRRDLPFLQLASERARTGATVYAVGNPSGLEHTVTKGIISSYRDVAGAAYVQTDAAINPGNSGGPIIAENGSVVGIATFILKDTEGLNFGVAAETIQEFVGPYSTLE